MRLLINRAVFLAGILLAVPTHALADGEPRRDYLNIVGSGTVHPFAVMVTERLVLQGKIQKPMLQESGSGGGFMVFCNGTGLLETDITLASRKMRSSEYKRCQENGVEDIVEIKFGYDGIVLAENKATETLDLSLRDIYLALARNVPAVDGEQTTIDNIYKNWNELGKHLPRRDIMVYGPTGGSGTSYVLARLGLEAGCRTFDWLREIKREEPLLYRQNCRKYRDDGAYIAVELNDETTLERLAEHPDALAIFSFGFLDEHADRLQAVSISGVAPTPETIADDSYPLSRPLYFYVKKQHIEDYPGIKTLIAEFTSEAAWGDEGYLLDAGLVPLSAENRSQYRQIGEHLSTMRFEAK